MRRSLRKAVAWSALGLGLLAAAGAGACLASLIAFPPPAPGLRELESHPWWFTYRDAPQGGAAAGSAPLWTVGACAACALLAALAGARANAHAERGGSSVALFFSVAFFTLCLEALRGPAALLFAWGHSLSPGVVLTRVVYGGRFAGELALLAAALHAMEINYRKNVVYLGILLLVALAIAFYIPIDRTAFLSSLLFKLGDEQGAWFTDLALGVLATAGLAGAAVTRRAGWTAALAVSSALLFAGREILSFSAPAGTLAAGLALLAAGMALALLALGRQTARVAELPKGGEPGAEREM